MFEIETLTIAVVILIIGPLLQIQGRAIRTRHPYASLPLPSTLILAFEQFSLMTVPQFWTQLPDLVEQAVKFSTVLPTPLGTRPNGLKGLRFGRSKSPVYHHSLKRDHAWSVTWKTGYLWLRA